MHIKKKFSNSTNAKDSFSSRKLSWIKKEILRCRYIVHFNFVITLKFPNGKSVCVDHGHPAELTLLLYRKWLHATVGRVLPALEPHSHSTSGWAFTFSSWLPLQETLPEQQALLPFPRTVWPWIVRHFLSAVSCCIRIYRRVGKVSSAV